MSYKIAIASGKGGTGKTTVATNLFNYFKENCEGKTFLVDCDVEEPNARLFFTDADHLATTTVNQDVPVIDTHACTFCRKCVEYCEFNAIVVIPPVEFAEVNPNLCHSCGACLVACDTQAIREIPSPIGEINHYSSGSNCGLIEGRLKIGSTMQTLLIKKLKKNVGDNAGVIIYDAPPGTSCSVVATVSETNYVIVVAEPTPFGLHDLKLMVTLLEDLSLNFGVIINKAGLGNDDIYAFINEKNIELIAEIPFDTTYAGQYAAGNLFDRQPEAVNRAFGQITKSIEEKIHSYERDHYFKW